MHHTPFRTPRSLATLCAFVLFFPCIAYSQSIGKLTGVAGKIRDGDTFVLLNQNSYDVVRLHSIDTPEAGQDYKTEAGQQLQQLLAGQKIDADCYKVDQYNRSVCRVFAGGVDVAARMIELGAAWYALAYRREHSPQEQQTLPALQLQAQMAKRGLWAYPDPVSPWDFKRGKRNK
jgi:micrococcal nuclease